MCLSLSEDSGLEKSRFNENIAILSFGVLDDVITPILPRFTGP
jgi:hypothetical protein